PHAISRRSAVLMLAISLSLAGAGCATTSGMQPRRQAKVAQDYDQAVIEYTKVLRQKPDDVDARRALERAKLRAAQDHLTRGRRFAANGRLDEALVELQTAFELNPGSGDIEETLRTVRNQQRTRVAVAREGKTQLE